MVEFINGLVYVIVFVLKGINIYSLLVCLLFSALLTLSVIDFKTFTIPPGFNIFIAILGVIRVITDFENWLEYLIGALCVSLFLLILYAVSKGRAIGGGDVGNGVVTISCGTVIATSAFSGAGIGGGFKGNGTVIINGGTVTASCLDCGAGIGVGYTGSGGSVTINGGTVTATNGYFGSGIGGGYVDSGIDVTINGGQVFAAGGDCEDYFEIKAVGIGRGGFGADDGTLTLGEGVALEVSSDNENWSDYDGTTRQQYMRTK